MSGEWKWSEPHKDYYMYRPKQGSSELELVWGRAQVRPPSVQPSPASTYSGNTVTNSYYSYQPQRESLQPYHHYPQDPRYAPQVPPHGGVSYPSYPPSSVQNSYGIQQAWYPNQTTKNAGGSSTTGSGGSSARNSAGAHASQGASTEVYGYMSPMTSPHLANDSLDPASDDEDIPNYHNEIRTLGKYISNTLQDPRYEQIQDPKRYFKKGRLFMVLWAEPGVSTNPIYTKVRRYVVLRRRQTHTLCLPIHTYGHLGTSKQGINPDSHAALICDSNGPVTHPNEHSLREEALTVVLESPTKELSPYSRIDFSRLFPISFNFKVRRIGHIHRSSMAKLEEYFRSGIGVHEPEDEDEEVMETEQLGLNDKQSHPLVRPSRSLLGPSRLMSSQVSENLLVRRGTSIQDAIASLNIQLLQNLLEKQFDEVAVGNYAWIKELDDADYTRAEIANLLFEEATDSPWIYFEPRVTVTDVAPWDPKFHAEGCVHHIVEGKRYPGSSGNPDSLLRVEDDEFIEEIQELCGLAGVTPTSRDQSAWLGMVNFVEGNSIAEVTYAVKAGDDFPRAILNSAGQTLQRFSHAFYRLQSAGLCCSTFTVIIQRHTSRFHPRDRGSVELRRVHIGTIMELLELLVTLATQPNRKTLNIKPIKDCVLTILRLFDVSLPEPLDISDVLHTVALVTQFISTGFLSYNQAHVGPLRIFYLDKPLKKILLLGACKAQERKLSIVAELTELTCIGNMLQAPVMTFNVHQSEKTEAYHSENHKYDLIATAEDLLDTWGPGSFIVPLESPNSLCGIRVCGGTIYRVNENDSLFHWAKNRTQELPQHSLNPRAKMRIGALVTVNTHCQIDERECWDSSRSALEYLGVQDDYWNYDENQIGIQAGQYVLLQHNRTRHKIPGKTLKQVLLEQDPQMIVYALNCLWGVQVSFCTGVTRRVPLRLLMADLLPVFAATLSMTPLPWDRLVTQYKVLDAFQSEDVQERLKTLPPDILSHLLTLMRMVLVTLQITGIDSDGGYLMVAWPYEHPPFGCFKIPCDNKMTSWVRVLADSGDCATFAYITTSCLETKTVKCRGPLPLWHNTTPLLETAIFRHNENPSRPLGPLEHKKTYFFKKTVDILKVTVERRGAAAAGTGSAGDVSLYVQSSSIPARFRPRLRRMEILKRESRIREIREGRETGAELVTILAKCERI